MSNPSSPSSTRENKNRIKVFVRCRPANIDEEIDDSVKLYSEANRVVIRRRNIQDKDYDFDRVFDITENHETIFKDVALEAIHVRIKLHRFTLSRIFFLVTMGPYFAMGKLEQGRRILFVVEHLVMKVSFHAQ